MNFVDLVPQSGTSKSINPSSSGASDTSQSGSLGNIYDGNNGTYYMQYAHHGGDGSVDGYLTFDATWTDAKTIYQVYVNGTIQMDGGNYFDARGSELDFTVYLKINGSWTSIASTGNIQNGKASDGASPYNYVNTINGTWNNVTGVRFYLHSYASSYEGNRNQYCWLYCNEVKCYREKYEEAFRMKSSSGTIKIGCQTLNNHPVRFRKGSTTVGLPLVSTSDGQASGLRFRHSGTTKSFILADS